MFVHITHTLTYTLAHTRTHSHTHTHTHMHTLTHTHTLTYTLTHTHAHTHTHTHTHTHSPRSQWVEVIRYVRSLPEHKVQSLLVQEVDPKNAAMTIDLDSIDSVQAEDQELR